MTNDKLLHKWINGELTEEELRVFKQRPEYDSLVSLYKNTEDLAAPGFNKEAMLAAILKADKKKVVVPSPGRRVFLSDWVRYAVAAALVLIAGWFLFMNNNDISYELAKGERKEGVLPDQSTFVLNAESSLSYDEKNWENDRTLQLEGEAFFSVNPGSKFTVETPNGKVQVLGTRFNVWSRDHSMDVRCQHGKVAVLTAQGVLIDELVQSEAIRIEPGKNPEKYQSSESERASWVDGISKLRQVKLAQVLAELERQFNIEIEAGNLNTEEVTSCNFQHEDLELALKTGLSQLNINYEIVDGKKVYLKK